MKTDLAGKTAIVTGGAKGYGERIVKVTPAPPCERGITRSLPGHRMTIVVADGPAGLEIDGPDAILRRDVQRHDPQGRAGRNGPQRDLCGLRVAAEVMLCPGQVQSERSQFDKARLMYIIQPRLNYTKSVSLCSE